MSLQVWLPLNGDLKNQGLSNVTVTNNSAVVDNNGKIGKCYSFNNSSIVINKTPYDIFTSNNSPFSISMWLYITSFNTNYNCGLFGCNQYHSSLVNGYYGGGFGISILSTKKAVLLVNSDSKDNMINFETLESEKWYHLVGTYDGITAKTYVNGELKNSAKCSWTINKTNIKAGIGTQGGWTYITPHKSNDLRIYDHCLSAKEVKELSKGLVLHYPLKDQYIENTTNISSQNSKGGWNNSGAALRETNNADLIKYAPYPNNVYSIKVTTAGNCALTFGHTVSNVPSKTLTCSVYCYLSGTQDSNTVYIRSTKTDGSIGVFSYNGSTNPTSWPLNQWIRLKATVTTNSEATTIYFCTYVNVLGNTRAFCGWQIEEKDHATPFTDSSRSETTIYDCSGYGYNGIKSGTIICNSDSPRYNVSYKFNGNSCIKNNKFYFNSSIWTVSLWYKYNTAPTSYEGLICLSKNDGSDSNKKFAIMPNSNYIWFKAENSSTSISSLKIGEWCHLAIVSNGTSAIIYENGVQKTTTTISSFIEGAYDLVVGARASSAGAETTSIYSKGNISDVRIYATALSADDVKELYNIPLSVDKKGNSYAYDYLEENIPNISKTGILENKEIIEGNNFQIAKDCLTANQIIEY